MTKKFELNCLMDTASGTCGVGVIYDFNDLAKTDKWYRHPFEEHRLEGGTGYEIAGFINTEICKKAYKYLTKKAQVVFQSPVRINTNSDNEFFFVILDFSHESLPIDNSKFEWPTFKYEGVE